MKPARSCMAGLGAVLFTALAACTDAPTNASDTSCDRDCLEQIADQYRAAYVKHDSGDLPLATNVRFSENSVMMRFPDASWDTVTREVGPATTISDPQTGQVGIYTSIWQNDTPGFLAIRLKIQGGMITEIEHMLSTKRNLSSPPTPIGDVDTYKQVGS